MPEISVGGGESFSALIFLGIEKNWIKRAEYQDFTSKIFCLTVPKNFRRGILLKFHFFRVPEKFG